MVLFFFIPICVILRESFIRMDFLRECVVRGKFKPNLLILVLENKTSKQKLCILLLACPTCYGLVQDAVNEHRSELQGLEDMINRTGELPQDNQNNAQFLRELDELNNTAHALLERGNENKSKLRKLCIVFFMFCQEPLSI